MTYIKKNHNSWQQKQLFYLHSIRVQDSFFIFLNIKYYIHMYCDFINIHWKQIFKDFVLKFSHEIKCSLKKNVWQQIFIKSIQKTNPQNWISLKHKYWWPQELMKPRCWRKLLVIDNKYMYVNWEHTKV